MFQFGAQADTAVFFKKTGSFLRLVLLQHDEHDLKWLVWDGMTKLLTTLKCQLSTKLTINSAIIVCLKWSGRTEMMRWIISGMRKLKATFKYFCRTTLAKTAWVHEQSFSGHIGLWNSQSYAAFNVCLYSCYQ